jgi:thiol-disulfide isomerase/thioredoxin
MKKIIAMIGTSLILMSFVLQRGIDFSLGMNYDFEVSVYDAKDFPSFIPQKQEVLIEVFSATWCGWCYYAYDIHDRLSTEYGLPIHHVRYYNQDSLAMKEAPERTAFYKISGFPTLIVNGDKKLLGANEQSYPEVAKWVEESLAETPQAGVYSYGRIENDRVHMLSYVQAFSDQELDLRFVSVLMENNVKTDKDKTYHYVARSVFPSYDGLKINLMPNKIYRIEYSYQVPNIEKKSDYKVLSFIQNFDTKKIYNSSFFELNSLIISSHEPADFSSEIARDSLVQIQFQEALSVASIKQDHILILDDQGNSFHPVLSYDPPSRTLTIDPMQLLKKNTGYALLIQGGPNALYTSSRKSIRDYFCIPFKTGAIPEIEIDLSSLELDFKSVSPIDEPLKQIEIKEKNDFPIRIQYHTKDPWIEASLETLSSSRYNLLVKLNPLRMKTGINKGYVQVDTITGSFDILVTALMESNEYPAIRLEDFPLYTNREKIIIKGKTNGYRLFLGSKELELSLDGSFYGLSDALHTGMNVLTFRAINMQRKEAQKVLIVFKIN